MPSDSPSGGHGSVFKGAAGLLIAVGVVVGMSIAFPAYRWFFLLSVGIGVLVAGGLYFWHRLRPLKEEDVDKKHPLGLN